MSHICHITTAHQVFDTRIFRRECVSLAKAGFKVTLIAKHDKEEVVHGVRILPLVQYSNSGLERRLFLPRRATKMAQTIKADLYHFHDPELVLPMRQLARQTKRPVVWDAHENYVSTISHFNVFRLPLLSRLVAQWFDKSEIEACKNDFAGVVTITPIMAKRYRSHGIETCVSGNFTDISTIAYPPRVQRARRPRLMSSGLQFVDKGVFEIADAFQIARRELACEVAFWGIFQPPNLSETLRTRIVSTQVPETDVIIGGPYPWKTLVEELVPTAWVGCVLFNPKDQNNLMGLPNRFFECWANRVPVIATAGTQVARLVEEERGGVVVKDNDPQAIANAFLRLVKEPDLLEAMGASGRRAVEEKYNWAMAFQNLLSFYAELGVVPFG